MTYYDDIAEHWEKKYPICFRNKSSCFLGAECSKGWYGLIEDLISKIEDHLTKKIETGNTDFVIDQIKEKYGDLRFYVSNSDDVIDALIKEAEKKSSKTCELCGDEGALSVQGLRFKTLCKKCGTENGWDVAS